MNELYKDDIHLSTKDKRLGILLWYYVSRFFNHSIRLSNQHLKDWELSIAQFDVLVQVGSQERVTQKELGEKLLVTKGNITQLIGKMEKLGWVQREREWKTKHISLTEEGRALYEKVVPQQESFQAVQFDPLNREEQQQLLGLLKKLYQGIDQNEELS